MLQTTKQASPPALIEDRTGLAASSLADTFQALTGLFRRRYPIFIVVTLMTLGIGILYVATTPSIYTANALMVIDTRKLQAYQPASAGGELGMDAETVQTQVDLLQSANVVQSVVRDLHLTDDPEFTEGRQGFSKKVFGLLSRYNGPPPEPSEAQVQRQAVASFQRYLNVARDGQTYVMQVSFQSTDPIKAARIANAVVEAYITDQLEAKFQSTKRASLWMQDRIGELRSQATTADRAVVTFKTTNNIVDADGQQMNEQQLSGINNQLMLAHAATAEAKARVDRINDVMKQPIPDAFVTDALHNEIIVKLRSQYLELAGREAIYSTRYGVNHEAVVNIRTQMNELQRNMADEMRKIGQTYQSEYTIAQAREDALSSSLKSSVTESQATNQAKVDLHELQSSAQSYRSLYDSFLQRYMDAVQQQSFPLTEARLISPAEAPGGRSWPNVPSVIGASLAGGLLLSFGLALFREMGDRVFRASGQIEDKLGIDCLATLPVIRSNVRSSVPARIPEDGLREIALPPGLWRHALDQPFSAYAEGLRSVKITADLAATGRSSTVIGITSTLPGEGKSTIAANFAALLAHAGNRVLLVDADLRNPSLSRHLAPLAERGLVDVINGRAGFDACLWTETGAQFAFMPSGAAPRLLHTNALLGSEAVRNLFKEARARYDYILVDLAPLAPVVDTRATVHFVDSYIYTVEWGRTRTDVIAHVLGNAREIHDNILGAVINKADLSILSRYERHHGRDYHRKYYRRYGYTT